MTRVVEFFFDFGSPTVYLAATQLPGIAEQAGATIDLRPMLLGGVFKATGNQSPVMVPAKGTYMGADLARFATRYGVTYKRNPFFPVNTLALMRGAVAYRASDRFKAYRDAIFKAMWVEPCNLNEPEIIAKVLTESGFDPGDFMARIAEQSVKDELKANTEEAVQRGAFGAPTFFVDGQMFFGQDRLDFVAEALDA